MSKRKGIYPDLPKSTDKFNPKPRGLTYLELKLEDALYLPKLCNLPLHLFSEDAGWGLERPDSQFISYQRLWEYPAYQDTLREAVGYDIEVTGKYPFIEASYHGVGFEEQVGRLPLNH